jgi:hypothetical protein
MGLHGLYIFTFLPLVRGKWVTGSSQNFLFLIIILCGVFASRSIIDSTDAEEAFLNAVK